MLRFFAVVLIALGLAACSTPSRLPSLDPPAPLQTVKSNYSVKSLWTVQVGKGVDRHFVRLPPLLDDKQVIIANRKGLIQAHAMEGGALLWRKDMAAAIHAGPADGDDLVLFGGDAEVIALDKKDGSLRWRAEVKSEVLAPPLRSGAMIVVRTIDGGLFGLDSHSGRRLWHYTQKVPLLSLRGNSTPLIIGDRVIAGFANGKVAAVSLRDGRPIWETAVAIPRGRTELERIVDVDAQLAVAGRTVYAVSFHGRLAALNLDNGRLLWQREMSSYTGMSVVGGALYFTDSAGDVWALSRNSGATLWKQDALHGRGLSAPVVQSDRLLVGDYEGYLHWLSLADGELLARARVEDWEFYYPVKGEFDNFSPYDDDRAVLATPQVKGGRIYAMDKRGVMNVFKITAQASN